MFCVSIAEKSVVACQRAWRGADYAEIRLDRCALDEDQIALLFARARRRARPLTLIATCRPGMYSAQRRFQLLRRAIQAGANFVDIERESPAWLRRQVRACARRHGSRVIISYHNFERTPDRRTLEAIVRDCVRKGADVVKIACAVKTPADAARLMGLLDSKRRLIVSGMGPQGRLIRLVAPLLGSVVSYVSVSSRAATAPGQFTLAQAKQSLRVLTRLGGAA